MSSMFGSLLLMLTVHQVVLLHPTSANSETVKLPLELKSSLLAHTDLDGLHEYTTTDVTDSENVNNIRSNTSQPKYMNSVDALDNYLKPSPVGSYTHNNHKSAPSLMSFMRWKQGAANKENWTFPGQKMSNIEKSFQSRRSQRFDRGHVRSGGQTLDDGGPARFIKSRRNEEPIVGEDNDEDKSFGYGNINVMSNLKCQLKGSSSPRRKRDKRESIKGYVERNNVLTASSRLSDEVINHLGLREEYNLDDGRNNDDILMRTTRDRLNRMPITFGKRDEDQQSLLVRSVRDRLGRMPATFGKRGIDDEAYKHILLRVLKDILSQQFPFFRSDEESEDDYDNSVSFTRISKGSLHRMPLTFGKRDSRMTNRVTGEESDTSPNTNLKSSANNPNYNAETSDTNPIISRYQNRGENKLDHYSMLQLPVFKYFIRHQRSKLERMPLAFGKRHYNSNGLTFDTANLHKIKQRSRLDRMPVSYGKRALKDETIIYVPELRNRLSSGYGDDLRSSEAKENQFFESRTAHI